MTHSKEYANNINVQHTLYMAINPPSLGFLKDFKDGPFTGMHTA
jgi:hypothetical protein